MDDLIKGAADNLDSTAAYVQNRDIIDMLGNLRHVVRQHPSSFLVGAAAVGFLLASGMTRKRAVTVAVTANRESEGGLKMTSQATKMAPETSAVSEVTNPAKIIDPTDNEIATVAFQLWLDSGCPVGSDKEHWFRAEAMLRNTLMAKREELSTGSSIPRPRHTRAESEMAFEFSSERWDGHWEVWEREWGCARWITDVRTSAVGVSNRAG
jgi:Protein of unknown function (DUF2934)